jgi:hypothetical protein
MRKICQLDVLNVDIVGVSYINVTYTDEVGKVFLSSFPQGFVWTFGVSGIGGRGVGLR